jgi:hypothetical protein
MTRRAIFIAAASHLVVLVAVSCGEPDDALLHGTFERGFEGKRLGLVRVELDVDGSCKYKWSPPLAFGGNPLRTLWGSWVRQGNVIEMRMTHFTEARWPLPEPWLPIVLVADLRDDGIVLRESDRTPVPGELFLARSDK